MQHIVCCKKQLSDSTLNPPIYTNKKLAPMLSKLFQLIATSFSLFCWGFDPKQGVESTYPPGPTGSQPTGLRTGQDLEIVPTAFSKAAIQCWPTGPKQQKDQRPKNHQPHDHQRTTWMDVFFFGGGICVRKTRRDWWIDSPLWLVWCVYRFVVISVQEWHGSHGWPLFYMECGPCFGGLTLSFKKNRGSLGS